MHLTMTLGRIIAQRLDMDYTGLVGAIEKQHYQQRQAELLRTGNAEIITRHCVKPVFYIDRVQSKMNDEEIQDYDWDEIKAMYSDNKRNYNYKTNMIPVGVL